MAMSQIETLKSDEPQLTELSQPTYKSKQNNLQKLVESCTQQLLSSTLSTSILSNSAISSENSNNEKLDQLTPNVSIVNKENIQNFAITQPKQQQIKTINQFLRISNNKGRQIQNISFGQCLPGQVLEEQIIIENISSQNIVCELRILCLDEILDQLSEYVYSVRKKENYSYNESQVFKLQPGRKYELFVALKTPNIKKEQIIPGQAIFRLAGIKDKMQWKIGSNVKIPKINCLKQLYCQRYDMPVIKLAMKLLTKAECKIPLKNLSAFNVKTEFELIKSEENKFGKGIEFWISPEQGILSSGQVSMIVLNAKKVGFNYEMIRSESSITVNLILMVKIQNSSIFLCFPLMIELY